MIPWSQASTTMLLKVTPPLFLILTLPLTLSLSNTLIIMLLKVTSLLVLIVALFFLPPSPLFLLLHSVLPQSHSPSLLFPSLSFFPFAMVCACVCLTDPSTFLSLPLSVSLYVYTSMFIIVFTLSLSFPFILTFPLVYIPQSIQCYYTPSTVCSGQAPDLYAASNGLPRCPLHALFHRH